MSRSELALDLTREYLHNKDCFTLPSDIEKIRAVNTQGNYQIQVYVNTTDVSLKEIKMATSAAMNKMNINKYEVHVCI